MIIIAFDGHNRYVVTSKGGESGRKPGWIVNVQTGEVEGKVDYAGSCLKHYGWQEVDMKTLPDDVKDKVFHILDTSQNPDAKIV